MNASTPCILGKAAFGGRRCLLLAVVAASAAVLATPQTAAARGAGGGGRMATASVASANRAAGVAPGRPAQLPATPGVDRPVDRNADGWGWYYGYAYGSSGDDDRTAADDRNIDVDGVAAAAAAAAATAAVAAATAPAPPAAGSVVYELQPGCSTVERNGAYLRFCGGVYYKEQFEGDRVAYLVVNP